MQTTVNSGQHLDVYMQHVYIMFILSKIILPHLFLPLLLKLSIIWKRVRGEMTNPSLMTHRYLIKADCLL